MQLHEGVKRARLDLGWSQARLATEAGVPRERVRSLEDGANITLSTLEKIITVLPNLKELSIGRVHVSIVGIDVKEVRAAVAASEAANRHLLSILTAIEASEAHSASTAKPSLETRLAMLEDQVNAIPKQLRNDS